jgi:hypothetical protein
VAQTVNTLKDVVVVPQPAVIQSIRGPIVYVVTNGVATLRPVKLLHADAEATRPSAVSNQVKTWRLTVDKTCAPTPRWWCVHPPAQRREPAKAWGWVKLQVWAVAVRHLLQMPAHKPQIRPASGMTQKVEPAMNLSELFIRRPVMTVLLNLAIVMAGVIGFRSIPIAALPSYDTPVISVSASLPGASPETMATSVALPLEKQFQTVPGLQTISSTSTLGNTSLTLEFEEGRNIDAAAVDVQAALLRAQRALPDDMTSPPSYRKVNPADAPVLLISLRSPSIAPADLQDYAEHLISPTLVHHHWCGTGQHFWCQTLRGAGAGATRRAGGAQPGPG